MNNTLQQKIDQKIINQQATEVFKALSNDYRLDMLLWLKNPETHFVNRGNNPDDFDGGVCVGIITEKTGLAQSVVSSYLNNLKTAGLVESKRIGKWTYYRYNHQAVQTLLGVLDDMLS